MAYTIEEFEKKYGVHFTTKHSGKMSGMISISTSCLCNEHCVNRSQVKGSICEKCFSFSMHNMYGKCFCDCFAKNTEVLTSVIIPKKDMPIINAAFIRIEAFGDIGNETQVINYFTLASANKHAIFAMWTKNPIYIAMAIAHGYKKPKNMIIIYSSPMINSIINTEKLLKVYPFIDKVFTVYDKKFIKENDIKVNCGARSCLKCRRCYTRKKGVEEIREQLKGKG